MFIDMPETDDKFLTHAELLRCLVWDPETGKFAWRIDISQRVKAGDPAGVLTPDGRYVVTLHRKRYYGHRLAYFYATGGWPEGEPRFRDYDRSNCSAGNLYFTKPTYSSEPRAIAARKATQRRRDLQRLKTETQVSPISGIVRTVKGEWLVYHPAEKPVNGAFHIVIGQCRSFAKATLLYYERLQGFEFVEAHPPKPIKPEDHFILAGPAGSITLADAKAYLAYDPASGAFYHRIRHTNARRIASREDSLTIKGLRADAPNTNGSPVIGFFGRDYSAASLAIFMQKGFWPARRSVQFKDGNKANTAWSNLLFEEPAND